MTSGRRVVERDRDDLHQHRQAYAWNNDLGSEPLDAPPWATAVTAMAAVTAFTGESGCRISPGPPRWPPRASPRLVDHVGDAAIGSEGRCRGTPVLRGRAARVVEDAEVDALAEVVADLGDHDVAAAGLVLVVDDVRAVVPVEQVRTADVHRADVTVPDQRLLVVDPVTPVRGPTPVDVTVVGGVVQHEQHHVAGAPRGQVVAEDPGVRRLRGARREHGRRQHDLVVREVDAVGRTGEPGRGVLAVEVQPEFLGVLVPQHMR